MNPPLRFLLAALAAPFLLAVAAWAGDPTGTWKFQVQGPRGGTTESTLSLNWSGGQLSGTIDNRAGQAAISDATFADDQVSFMVVREFKRRFRHFTLKTHYSGKLDGDTITGTIETTGRDKQPVSIPWSAKRSS